MPRRYFEFIDELRAPGATRDTGTYPVKHDDHPRCLFEVIDLSIRPAIDYRNCIYSITYDQTHGEGERFYYQVAITEVLENKSVSEEELKELTEYCWDWWLSYYLL